VLERETVKIYIRKLNQTVREEVVHETSEEEELFPQEELVLEIEEIRPETPKEVIVKPEYPDL
jgi:hypothetical protein